MKEKRTELLVGLFLLIGMALLGGLVLRFGNFDERFKGTYPLTVTFEDGAGLVKDTDVRLGGVKIGRVTERPRVNVETYGGAIVELEIFDDFQIPEGSSFKIGSSGLMGDSLVEITVPEKRNGVFIGPGTIIEGESSTGFSALASSAENLSQKGQVVLEDVRSALQDIGSAVEKLDQSILREENLKRFDTAVGEMTTALEALNSKVLGDDNTDNLRTMLANLKTASEKVDGAADKLGPMFDEGGEAIAELKPGLEKLANAATSANAAMDKLSSGDGLLAALLEDPKIKRDVEIFVANLRKSGVLRYKDSGDPASASSNEEPRRKGIFGR